MYHTDLEKPRVGRGTSVFLIAQNSITQLFS